MYQVWYYPSYEQLHALLDYHVCHKKSFNWLPTYFVGVPFALLVFDWPAVHRDLHLLCPDHSDFEFDLNPSLF